MEEVFDMVYAFEKMVASQKTRGGGGMVENIGVSDDFEGRN